MSDLRAALRLAGLVAWTAAIVAGLLVARAALRRRDAGRRLLRLWARGAARLLGIAIAADGEPPRGSFVLVANHLSYLDVIVVASLVEVDFVAKSDVARWPVVGRLCRLVDTVFIDRSRKRDLVRVLDVLERRLRDGGGVAVFPEGTTSDGSAVLPFKSSLFELSRRTERPIRAASLTYATPAEAPHPSHAVCWWGDMAFAPHLWDLLRVRAVHARVEFVPGSIVDADRKRLARAAHRAVRRRFQPVSRGDLSCLPAAPAPA